MITKSPCSDPQKVAVTFQVPSPKWAQTVHLVGDFNRWDHHTHPLIHSDGDDIWYITLELLRDQSYQFRYLINGNYWENDGHADRFVSNPFGGDNSIVDT